jgi:tRNA modification GTPase
MIPLTDDTIAAIATPPGPGGIGIIRISGPRSLSILKKLFKPHRADFTFFASHKMYYGWVVDPAGENLVDEVLAVFMQGPHSYTREDVVEIQCHGSFLVLQEILSLVLQEGARLAEPGEFTKRAFLNGRIDLTQAEAVLEVLQAKTSEGLQMAMAQLHGRLHDVLNEIKDALLSVLAVIEVAIDFPEDDVEILNTQGLLDTLKQNVQKPLAELIASSAKGKVYRDGISVVILGRPNVGKSSMLNRLLREERAIVTAFPGTTRDTIEEYINIKGMPVRVIDTAGIREGVESVEEAGIQRAKQKLEEADLILFLVDASETPSKEDQLLYASIQNRPHLLVLNKIDIAASENRKQYPEIFSESKSIESSTKTGEGLDNLEQAIFDQVTGGGMQWDPGHASLPNVRHQQSICRAAEAVSGAINGLAQGNPPDLVAVDVQAVLGHLGDIVGESTPEDVLNVIFEKFCIGK